MRQYGRRTASLATAWLHIYSVTSIGVSRLSCVVGTEALGLSPSVHCLCSLMDAGDAVLYQQSSSAFAHNIHYVMFVMLLLYETTSQ